MKGIDSGSSYKLLSACISVLCLILAEIAAENLGSQATKLPENEDKADAFSFGVLVLEIVSGQSNARFDPKKENSFLLNRAHDLQEKGCLLELVDPSLGSDYSEEEVLAVLNVALLCTSMSPSLRPTMSSVVDVLEGRAPIHQAPTTAITYESFFHARESNNFSHDNTSQSKFSDGDHDSGFGQRTDSLELVYEEQSSSWTGPISEPSAAEEEETTSLTRKSMSSWTLKKKSLCH